MSFDLEEEKIKWKRQHRKNRESKIRHLPKQKGGQHGSKKEYHRHRKHKKDWIEEG